MAEADRAGGRSAAGPTTDSRAKPQPASAPADPQASASPARPGRRRAVQADLRTDPHTGPPNGPHSGPHADPHTDPHAGPHTGPHTGPPTGQRAHAAAGVVAGARRGGKGVKPADPVRPATAPCLSHLNPAQDRQLRQLLADCRRLLSERGEANGPGIAAGMVSQLDALADDLRGRFFDHLARDFSPDAKKVLAAALAYAQAPGHTGHLIHLTQCAEPPRQELFRRLNRAPGGTAALVRLRRALLERLPRQPTLASVEHDLLHLLGSWFNPGFLQMRKVDWNSPAQLLEQIIRHEAVHEVDGWDDLRRRLQPDRRCFAFFHPQLPDEPLIFVEVALVPEMAGAIAPLIDKKSGSSGLSVGDLQPI